MQPITALHRESSKRRAIRSDQIKFALFLLLAVFWNVLPKLVSISGVLLFASGQERGSRIRTAGGILLALIGVVLGGVFLTKVVFPRIPVSFHSSWGTIFGLASVPFTYFAAKYYRRAREAQRDLLLLQAASAASGDRDSWLAVLSDAVSRHHGDLNLHQRYAEALLLSGRIAEAIAEAKLILRIDPYNFQTTLFLACAYFEAQLYEESQAVCNGYLMVAGYCYEFRDLLDRCQRAQGVSDAV